MASSYSTLVVTLAGLQLQNLQQVITARGIDRVLVVDTPSGFNGASGIAAVASAGSLRSAPAGQLSATQAPALAFAFAGGESSVSLSSQAYKAIASQGFTFVNDPALASFSKTVVVDAAAVSGASPASSSYGSQVSKEVLGAPSSLSSEALYNGSATPLAVSRSSFANAPTISVGGGGISQASILSDLAGTAKVKLSATEFNDLALRNGLAVSDAAKAQIAVANAQNILVGEAAQPLAQVPAPIRQANGLTLVTTNPNNRTQQLSAIALTNLEVDQATFTTLAAANQQQGDYSPAGETTEGGKFFFSGSGRSASGVQLNASQIRSLPAEGVASFSGAVLTLQDTAANLSVVLAQLSDGQLASISRIVVSDSQPLLISAANLRRLDLADWPSSWSSHNGVTAVVQANGSAAANLLVSGSLADVRAAGLLNSSGALQTSLGAVAANLVSQVKAIELSVSDPANLSQADCDAILALQSSLGSGQSLSFARPDAISLPSQVSVAQLKTLSTLQAKGLLSLNPASFALVDSQANLQGLLLDAIDATPINLSVLSGVRATDSAGLLELTYGQYLKLTGSGNGQAKLTLGGLSNIRLEVSGTAAELNALFATFGTDFSGLANAVSFRITDGGEVTLNADQLNKLDGRLEGAVVVADTNANLERVFDNAVPGVVKSFQLVDSMGNAEDADGDGSLDGDTIRLSVNGLGGLPGYLDANVILRDTDENLERRLRSDLDYRVSRIEVSGTASGNSETALNLRIGQLERLLENGVQIADGLAIVLDPRDTLEVNAKGAAALPNGFQGSLVIADDGDALRSLFDPYGIWTIPAGATDVQLRSLDNAPLRLNVDQLEQLVGSYPGFSGAIQLVDEQLALKEYIDGAPEAIDPRVVAIAVEGLSLPLGGGADRLELTATQLNQLRLAEADLDIQLFAGTITLDDSSVLSTAAPLPTDSRLELTAAQVNAKLQALLNSVNDQIRPDLNALKDSILNTTPNDGPSSVIERLNELAAQVTKLDLETVTVAEFRTLVAAAGTPSTQKFTVADNVSALSGLLGGPEANLDANVVLLLQRITRLIPTEAADAALSLSFAQLELLPATVQVENLLVVGSNTDLLHTWDAAAASFSVAPRVDAIRLAAPAGLQAEPLELSVAQYQAIANRIPEGRFELVDTDAALLSQLRSAADSRVVAIRPADGVLSVSSLADLALLPEVIGRIAFTTTSQDLAAAVRHPEFEPHRFSVLASSDGLPLTVDAETLALLPAGLDTPNRLVLRDSAGDVAEVLSGALDPRLVGIESRSGELVLNVSQLQRLETLTSNLKVALRDDAVAIETYLADGVPSVLISAISVSNGDRLSLSSESFANLLTLEAIGGGSRVYAGQIDLAAGSGDVDFVPAQLADLRVSSLSVQGSDQLVLSVAELERLGAGFSGKVILEDGLEAIRTLLGGDLDGRVNGIRAIDLDTNALVPLQLNADQLSHLPAALQAAVTVVENSAGIAQLLATPQSSSFKLLVPAGGLNLSAEQFVNLGSAQLVNGQGAATTVVVRDTAEDLAGLIDIDPNRPLDARIAALQPTNSDRLSLSLAQVANLPVRITTSIVVADSAENLLARLTPAGGTGLDARIKGFDLINGTEITLSGAQFKSLQAVEARLGHQLLSGPFKLRGLAGEEAVLADILDDLDSRVEVVSSPAIRTLTLTSAQLRELDAAYSGDVILRDNAGGIVNELIRGLDARVVSVQTEGTSELTLGARQLLNLPSDFAGKVILDDSLANIRSFITKPYSLPASRTLQLSIDQLAELTQLTAENSLLTGEGRLVVTAVRPGLAGVRTSDGLRNVNDALKTVPNSFKSLTVQVEGALDLSAAGGEEILGLLVDQAKRRDATAPNQGPLLYSEDRLVVAADSSLRLSAAQLIANDLQQLVKAGAVTGTAAQPQLLLTDVTGAQDLSTLDANLNTTALFSSNQTIDAAKLTRVDAIGFGSSTLTLTAASADQLQSRFVASSSGHLEITGYSGQNLSSLNNKAASIDLNIAGVQSISAAAAPAKATLTITGTALVDATDAVALKSRLVNGNPSGGNPGEVRVLGYTNQDLAVAETADLSRSKPEGLKLTVQVSAAADISAISGNHLADADEINIAAGGSLTLSTAQALGSSLLAARIQGVTGGSLTITGYNGENLGDIAPAAGALAINFVLSNGGDLRSIAVADLLAFTADADSLTIPSGKTLQLTAEQTLALKAKLTGGGNLRVTDYTNQDLTQAGSGFIDLNVTVEATATSDISSATANRLNDVDVVQVGGNDLLTITGAQAEQLKDNLRGVAAVNAEQPGQVLVKDYQGGDLRAIADDPATSGLALKLQISNSAVTAELDFLDRVSDADVIEVVSGGRLTLSADQAVALASKLQGSGQLVITGYSTQNLSTLAGSLSTTLTLPANAAVTTDQSKLFASNAGVDKVQLAATAKLTLGGYTGLNLADLITKDAGAVLNVNIDDQLASSRTALTPAYKVDLSTTTNGGLVYLAPVNSINIGANTELLINAGTNNTTFTAVKDKLAKNAGLGTSQGVLHVADVTSGTPLAVLNATDPSLTVDVTLKSGSSTSFTTSGFGELAYVRNIFLPASATLALTFGQAVTDRTPPALTAPDDFFYDFIKNVPGQSRGELSLAMSDYLLQEPALRSAGLTGLLAAQNAGNFQLSLAIPSNVSLELQASDLAQFHTKLGGTGALTVANYNGENISGLEVGQQTPASLSSLQSLTIKVAANASVNLADDASLPVLTNNKVAIEVGSNAKLTYLEAAATTNLDNRQIALATGATFAVQANLADAFSYAAGSAIDPSSTIQLVGFDGTETITKVNATNAKLHAVVGQPSTASATGAAEVVTLSNVNLANVSAVDVVSVAAGSTLSLDAGLVLPAGLQFGFVGGSLTATAAQLTGKTIAAASPSAVNLGGPGTITVKGIDASVDLDGIAAGYQLDAELTTVSADQLVFSAAELATVDRFVITTSGTFAATAAELDGRTVVAASGAPTLNISDYTNQDLSKISSAFSLSVTTLGGASLVANKLTNVDTITVVGANSAAAADASALGARLSGAGTLNVSGYANQDLRAITTNTVNLTTVDGASLVAANLSSVDFVTVVGVNTLSAVDAASFVPTFVGTGTLKTTDSSATAVSLIQLNTKSSALIDAASIGAITGSATAVAAVYAAPSAEIIGLGNEAVTLQTDPTTAELKAINLATDGTIRLTGVSAYGLALSGTAADLAAALSGTFGAAYTGGITITGTTASAADLKAINLATEGALDASNVLTITGSAADVNAVYTALAGEITGLGGEAVTLNTDPSLAELKAINVATEGTISLTGVSAYGLALSGSAADLAVALSGTFGAAYTGAVSIISTATEAAAADLKAINLATAGALDASNVLTITGSAADVNAVYTAPAGEITGLGGESVTLQTDPTTAELKAINLATDGTIRLTGVSAYGLALSGSAADLAAALSGTFGAAYTGAVSIISTATEAAAADLKAINLATAGALDASNVLTITGSAADVNEVYTAQAGEITGLGGEAVTLNTDPSLAELKAINVATAGTISLTGTSGYGLALSGSAADLAVALSGTFGAAYTGGITITGTIASAADLKAINLATTGVVNASSVETITGSAADVNAVYTAPAGEITGLGGESVTLQTDPTTAELKAINLATDGTIRLTGVSAYGLALSGTAADLAAALSGTFGAAYTGAVSVTSGPASVVLANALDQATSGLITATIGDLTIAQLKDLTGTGNAYAITVSDSSVDAADLNALAGKTTLTVNAGGVGTLTGTTAAIKQAITAAAIDTATNVVVTIGDVAATDLLATDLSAISAATTGSVTVTNAVKVSGSASDLLAAVSASDTSVGLNAASTLIATSYAGENLSVISAAFDLKVSLAADTSVGNRNLSTADQLTVAAGKTLTLTSADDSTTNLTDLDRVILNGTGAKLVLDQASRLEAPSLSAIQGTSASGEEVQITTSAGGAQSVNLKQISDITGVDSFIIDADTNNSTLSVRLSDTLSKSSKVSVVLESTSPLNVNRDTVLVESNLTGATTGNTVYTSTTTWAELGLGGASVYNFVPNKDSFGVVDSSNNFVFNTWQLGLPSGGSGGSFTSDGKVYLDITGFVNIDLVQEVRNYIGDNISLTNRNVDTGFALINSDADGNLDIGLFHVKWLGADAANPTASSADLQVTRLAVLQNVDADATLGLTSVIAAPNFIAKAIPTGLA